MKCYKHDLCVLKCATSASVILVESVSITTKIANILYIICTKIERLQDNEAPTGSYRSGGPEPERTGELQGGPSDACTEWPAGAADGHSEAISRIGSDPFSAGCPDL